MCLSPRAGSAIPRLIHQTWSSAELPSFFRRNVAALRARNPGWAYRYWSDAAVEDCIAMAYGAEVLRLYQRIDPRYGAARADLFRYLCIHHFGGVYLDIKSTAHRPLDRVIAPGDRMLLSQWRNGPGEGHAGWGLHPELADLPGGEFQQWHLIAAPGHPLLAHAIPILLANLARYDPARHGTGRPAVLRITGPIAYSRALLSGMAAGIGLGAWRMIDAEACGLCYEAVRGYRRWLGTRSYRRQEAPLVR